MSGRVWGILGKEDPLDRKESGAAIIFHPETGSWTEMPNPHTQTRLYDIVFNKDGRKSWISLSDEDEAHRGVFLRTESQSAWTKLKKPLPAIAVEFPIDRLGSATAWRRGS